MYRRGAEGSGDEVADGTTTDGRLSAAHSTHVLVGLRRSAHGALSSSGSLDVGPVCQLSAAADRPAAVLGALSRPDAGSYFPAQCSPTHGR